MYQDCRNCQHNYTGACRPSDVGNCVRKGRHTRWKELTLESAEFCECGADLEYDRSLIRNTRLAEKTIPRARKCPECGRRWVTGEFRIAEYAISKTGIAI